MKVACVGQALEMVEGLRREGLEAEVAPLEEAEVVMVESAAPEASRLAGGCPLPLVWLVPERGRELLREARRAGVFGLVARGDDPLYVGLILESAARSFRERRELSQEVARLERALQERKTVERAKGFLMDRYGLKEREAYARLRRLAMDARRPLAEVAEMVLLVGEAGKEGGRGQAGLQD